MRRGSSCMRSIRAVFTTTLAVLTPAVAFAQAVSDPALDARAPQSTAPAAASGQPLPMQSNAAPAPTAPPPTSPAVTSDVVEQPGVDDRVRYARAGVREVGGSAGLALAQDIRAVNFSPSIGWFLSDNFAISGILDVTNLKAGEEDATLWSALV